MSATSQFINQRWTSLQKVSFRFFFVFLSLQTLTENFLVFTFGLGNLFIWKMGDKIFTPPCLWLNNHFFHYKYIPQVWANFSGALHTIRDIVYLLLSVIICIIWTLVDRKRNSDNKLLYWFSYWLIIITSILVFAYGISKLIPVQMHFPTFVDLQKRVGDLTPFELVWTTFGYGQPYQVFTGFFEVLGAILIVPRQTRVVGLITIAVLMLNVMIIDYAFVVGNVMITAFYVLLIAMFLLTPYAGNLFRFFFIGQPVTLLKETYVPVSNIKTSLVRYAGLSLIAVSFSASTISVYRLSEKRRNSYQLAKCSVITNYVVKGDNIGSIGRTVDKWQTWYEMVKEGKRFVTITKSQSGADLNYTADYNPLKDVVTLYPNNTADTTPLIFKYTNIDSVQWHLEGDFNQKNIRIDLKRIHADTVMPLLKVKPVFIIFDDYSDIE